MLSGVAAAESLAVIHESGVESDERILIENELARLDRVAEQFTYVLPTVTSCSWISSRTCATTFGGQRKRTCYPPTAT